MGKLSYFMKEKDRTNYNYTPYNKQYCWNFPKNEESHCYAKYRKQRIKGKNSSNCIKFI